MSVPESWNEAIPVEMLASPVDPLSTEQINVLWALFRSIALYWQLDLEAEIFRSRWLDMLEARTTGSPDYRGEYINAASVYAALVSHLGEQPAMKTIFTDTIITTAEQATTRLNHAKFYVINDFVRCFVATGGFRGFVPKARNYTGFMGGSRFREWPPVRTVSK